MQATTPKTVTMLKHENKAQLNKKIFFSKGKATS